MRRAVLAWVIALAAIALAPARADAHIGSPDVFFEGDAGPYRLVVTVRTPDVIPGIAQIEIRSASPDVREVSVVPLRLTGPGSKLPPTPDRAAPAATDPQFFTASLWLMERGSLQVRIAVDGARGRGTLGVPVPAVAQRTLAMTRGLGGLLIALMLVLALSLVSIVAGAARAATLDPGAPVPDRARRRARRTAIGVGHADPARSALGDGATLVWDRPAHLRAGEPLTLRFRAIDGAGAPVALEPYMGMAGHTMVVRDDATVFAHLHPNGSVAMPALELARQTTATTDTAMPGMAMPGMDMAAMHAAPVRPEDLEFPYGFPRPGAYRLFVQVRHAGRIVTGAFDARVE
ncbi:MAG TPA: hypothetical protein VHW23_01470 [Kofleriaceae bacterium]|nr:hypothetical protein [Kofleriaceae bacterium]